MHLNLYTDYGLRVLLYLAAAPTRSAAAPDIATTFDISLNHLRKVVQALAREGYVTTTRGRAGGVSLARDAAEIRVGKVVRALETDLNIVECFDPHSNACIIAPCCGLEKALREAREAFFLVLDQYTLADLSQNRSALWRLLNRAYASNVQQGERGAGSSAAG